MYKRSHVSTRIRSNLSTLIGCFPSNLIWNWYSNNTVLRRTSPMTLWSFLVFDFRRLYCLYGHRRLDGLAKCFHYGSYEVFICLDGRAPFEVFINNVLMLWADYSNLIDIWCMNSGYPFDWSHLCVGSLDYFFNSWRAGSAYDCWHISIWPCL